MTAEERAAFVESDPGAQRTRGASRREGSNCLQPISRSRLAELFGRLLTEPEDAVSDENWIQIDAIEEGRIERVTVGVDPAGGYAVLADRSMKGDTSPAKMG